jgi:hypothetical protein
VGHMLGGGGAVRQGCMLWLVAANVRLHPSCGKYDENFQSLRSTVTFCFNHPLGPEVSHLSRSQCTILPGAFSSSRVVRHQSTLFDWLSHMTFTAMCAPSGDCKKHIHVWEPQEGGRWQVRQHGMTQHSNSVCGDMKHTMVVCLDEYAMPRTFAVYCSHVIG